MITSDRREIDRLRHHIESCPSVPVDSFVSKLVLTRLEQKLINPNGVTYCPNNSSKGKKKKHKERKPKSIIYSILTTLRMIMIDLPMTLLFISLVTTHLLHKYYIHYISPMIDAANWVDNDRLNSEFTYYERPCDVSDISTSSIDTVIVEDGIDDADDAVENFMVHGMSLFKNILDEHVSLDLRSHILKRNGELTEAEYIPLDTPKGRHSFGIDANEDPSVALALNQIGSHAILRETLEKLLGHDPAVAEITAITVEPGAREQGWHPDVKPDGNSLRYGQTFTHSYSLFIPLQNVTKRMGATELCPGTHYCGVYDLEDACKEGGFQATESNDPEKAWNTGDGLMMNQKMWHRGAAYHKYPNEPNPDRVVFILTFISRPNFGKDHRQLSHGTYFHIHPFMYGHTFNDLKNAQVSMSFPFSLLRSLGIWKPPNSNWGFDWVTTTSLRIANGENGYHLSDLDEFVNDNKFGLPSFLQGSLFDDSGWEEYIEDTMIRFRFLLVAVYVFLLVIYLMSMLILDIFNGEGYHNFYSSILRVICINICVLILAHGAATKVKETQFCESVDSNTIFARPFLPKPRHIPKEEVSIFSKVVKSSRPSTVPMKTDVLLGNRYDSKYIGQYINFLDYHPGNKALKYQLESLTDLYHQYQALPSIFQDEVSKIIDSCFTRLLTQNEYGEWTLMSIKERKKQTLKFLRFGQSGKEILPVLDNEVSILMANARYGTTIRTSKIMRQETLNILFHWRHDIIEKDIQFDETDVHFPKNKPQARRFEHPSLFMIQSNPSQIHRSTKLTKKESSVRVVPQQEPQPTFIIGDRILYNYQGSGYWIDGRIIHIEFGAYGYVERRFDDGLIERSGIKLSKVKPYVPLVAGDKIAMIHRECPRCPNESFPGIIKTVYPTFEYDVEFEDGGIDLRIQSEYFARAIDI